MPLYLDYNEKKKSILKHKSVKNNKPFNLKDSVSYK